MKAQILKQCFELFLNENKIDNIINTLKFKLWHEKRI